MLIRLLLFSFEHAGFEIPIDFLSAYSTLQIQLNFWEENCFLPVGQVQHQQIFAGRGRPATVAKQTSIRAISELTALQWAASKEGAWQNALQGSDFCSDPGPNPNPFVWSELHKCASCSSDFGWKTLDETMSGLDCGSWPFGCSLSDFVAYFAASLNQLRNLRRFRGCDQGGRRRHTCLLR